MKKVCVFFLLFIIVIVIISLFYFNNIISLTTENNHLINSRQEVIRYIKHKSSNGSIDITESEPVDSNIFATNNNYLIYESKINSNVILQFIEKSGFIEEIRIYSFDINYNKDINEYVKILIEELSLSNKDFQNMKKYVDGNVNEFSIESSNFKLINKNTSYYKTCNIIFNKEDSDLLYKCNSLNTSNEIYKHKQEEIEFLANYTFEQVEKLTGADSPSINDLNTAKFGINNLKTKIEEIQKEDYYQDRYSDILPKIDDWNASIHYYNSIIASKIMIEVPDFSKMTKEEAENWGKNNNITILTSTDYSNSVSNGNMISQSYAVGSQLEKGKDSVSIVYSIGRKATTEDLNALKKAQSYSDNLHMSKQGIYEQLISKYGEGFTEEAAQYAIEHVVANWNYNALQKAKSYQQNLNMSRYSIYEQLISYYGEQFTESEAQYAIDHLDD